MSYGLYISDGVNGGVITNSNSMFNSEFGFLLTASLNPGASTSTQFDGAGNASLIGTEFDDVPTNADLSISRNSTTDTLTITNNSSFVVTFTAKFFRFG